MTLWSPCCTRNMIGAMLSEVKASAQSAANTGAKRGESATSAASMPRRTSMRPGAIWAAFQKAATASFDQLCNITAPFHAC